MYCTCTCSNVSLHSNYVCFFVDLYTNDHIATLLQVYSELSKTNTISSPNVSIITSPLKTQSTPSPSGIPNIFVTTDNDYIDNGTECRRLSAYNIPVSYYC